MNPADDLKTVLHEIANDPRAGNACSLLRSAAQRVLCHLEQCEQRQSESSQTSLDAREATADSVESASSDNLHQTCYNGDNVTQEATGTLEAHTAGRTKGCGEQANRDGSSATGPEAQIIEEIRRYSEAVAFLRYFFSVEPHNAVDDDMARFALDGVSDILRGLDCRNVLFRSGFEHWKQRHHEEGM